ncbi:MAG TPA: tetratricopeptide repeat protein, partial [Tepidiformaceae bacterium]|nr:tetratricopeptide repeat protein [Tepidiformaceae bacterium]
MTSLTEPQSAQGGAARRPLSSVAARLLARARKEWEHQQFEAAQQSLLGVLALAPDEPDAIRLLGMAAQRLGNHAKAIDCFRRVLGMSPKDSDLQIGLG